MSIGRRWLAPVFLGLVVAGCDDSAARNAAPVSRPVRSSDQQDAETLGREILELVDRAVDYKGSHRGRPAASFRQMGVDSLTATTARRLVNVNREPLVTVGYRNVEGREVTSCRGDSHILEEAAIHGGRYTLMCTTRSGVQRPVQVGGPAAEP